MGQIYILWFLKWSIEKDKRHYFCGILAKSTQPDFNHEKTSGKLRLREKFSKVTGLNIFNVKVMKCKASPRNCSRLKETQEIWQINETYYSELDPIVFFFPFCYKVHYWNKHFWIRFIDYFYSVNYYWFL